MQRTDRQRGTLIGLAIGDALGAAVEFESPGTFPEVTNYRGGGPHRLAPGEWTDDSAGHGQSSEALAVLLGRVSARLRKEPTNTFGKVQPHPRQHQSRPEMDTGIRGVLNGRKQCVVACDPGPFRSDSRVSQLPRDVEGSSRPLSGIAQESESKRRRWSVNMGTREARLSRVVAKLGRSSDPLKHLPMRQPSGGAPVVVRGVNDDHMAKGCRMIRDWMTKMFFNLEASK